MEQVSLDIHESRRAAILSPATRFWPYRQEMRKMGLRYVRDPHGEIGAGYYIVPLTLEHVSRICDWLLLHGFMDFEGLDLKRWRTSEGNRMVLFELARANEKMTKKFRYVFEPYQHQVSGVHAVLAAERCLLLDDVGLGKSKQVIDAAMYLAETHESKWNRRVVLVCPNTLKRSWKEQLEEHHCHPYDLIIPGKLKGKNLGESRQEILAELPGWDEYPDASVQWVILNYEALLQCEDEFLEAVKGSYLILDECHRVKNMKAKTTQIIHRARPWKFTGLTATPIANHAEDVYSLVNLCIPGAAGWNFSSFDAKYIIRNKKTGWIYKYKNTDELKRLLEYVGIGRKKGVCADLPPMIEITHEVELNQAERTAYNRMEKDFLAWFDNEVEEAAAEGRKLRVRAVQRGKDGEIENSYEVRHIRMRQIACGYISTVASKDPEWVKTPTKIDRAVKLWDDAGRPRAIMWVHHKAVGRKVVDWIGRHKSTAHKHVWRIDGNVRLDTRHEHIEAWRKAPDGLLVCQMDCAGEGLNLQAAAYQTFIETPSTPRLYKQTVGRLHRIGQTESVVVNHIQATNTVDPKILEKVRHKLSVADDFEAACFGSSIADLRSAIK